MIENTKVMKLALETLENAEYGDYDKKELNKAIIALREELARQESTAWVTAGPHTIPLVTQQEPAAWTNAHGDVATNWEHLKFGKGTSPLYASPPAQRKPLTDEEYEALVEDLGDWSRYVEVDTAHQALTEHVRQVLAAHGIKENT